MHTNQFGEAGLEALAEVIEKGYLPPLCDLTVDMRHTQHARLKAACVARGLWLHV